MEIIKDKDFRIIGDSNIKGGEFILNDGRYFLVLEEQVYNNHLSVVSLEDGLEYAIGHGEIVEVINLKFSLQDINIFLGGK